MATQITRPHADQLKFTSRYSGEHILEEYLEAAEIGGRPIGSLLGDLFDASTGVVNQKPTSLDAAATAADRVQTGLDRVQTGLDRIQTGLDAESTAADRYQVGLDSASASAASALAEAAAISTAEDAAATAADRIQVAADRAATALDVLSTRENAIRATAEAEIAKNAADESTLQAGISATQAGLSDVARAASEAARDAAQLSAAVYANTALGLAATVVGQYFSVISTLQTEYLILYLHDTGDVATQISTYPSVAGTDYTIANLVHVKENGNDGFDGSSWHKAVATIERALEIAWSHSNPTVIEWAPNHLVYTNGHLDMPDNCVIKATHRTVFVRPNPGFEQRNVFRMGSGCFIEGIMFEGWQLDDMTNPTEGFAVSFRPGAVIRRVPYAHKIAVRTIPKWGLIAPPLDRANGNPEVPRSGGVLLADGLVCSQYSVFPNIMAWGATPVLPNGIGYCAKNGALINAVNAVSMWAHKHFLAINGGQIILSACSTQFGDYSLYAKGTRQIVIPTEVPGLTLHSPLPDRLAIDANLAAATQDIIDMMWGALVFDGYVTGWTAAREQHTRDDAASIMQALRWTLKTANQQPMLDVAKGLFNVMGDPNFAPETLPAFLYAFAYMRDRINTTLSLDVATQNDVTQLFNALIATVGAPVRRTDPSRITAIGHTWTAVMSGVSLTKIPPARNSATIADSIIEENEGVVIASGQDDQGNALFVGGLQITADTGELNGPPFDQAVRRIATRAAISRSF